MLKLFVTPFLAFFYMEFAFLPRSILILYRISARFPRAKLTFKRQPVAVGDGIHEGQLARLGLRSADGRRPVQWQRGRRRAAVRPRRQDVQFGSARQPGQFRSGAAVDGGCGGGRSVGDCRRAEQEFVQLGSRHLLDLLVRLLMVVVLVGLTG